jgi:hypothetical protein
MTQRILLAMLLALGAARAGPPEYELILAPRFDVARSSQAIEINDKRQVSGLGQTTALPGDRAVIWTIAPDNSVTVIDIGQIDGRRMFGRGINNHGEMTGYSWVNGVGEFGFRYSGGTLVLLENGFESPPDGGTFRTLPLKINDDGWISGSAWTGVTSTARFEAALWDPSGTMYAIGNLGGPDSSCAEVSLKFVAGTSETTPAGDTVRAFRWDFDTQTMEGLDVLPGSGHSHSLGRGVNNHGDVSGVSSAVISGLGPNTLGVVWYADGTVRQLDAIGTPGTDDIVSTGASINDAGWVVGFSSLGAFSAGLRHPILWLPDGTRIDLFHLLPAGATQAGSASISNTGWICGNFFPAGTTTLQPYVLRPTPGTQVSMLMDQVDRLDLGRIGRGLNLQLQVALEKIEDGKPHVAEKLLKVFAFEVKLLERLRRLDDVETDSLLAVVSDVLATFDE